MRVFVTGASGWIGSAVVPELIGAGHEVVGLARSDASATALVSAGAQVHRGTLDDLDSLRRAAETSQGVIHLAFKHDIAFTGDFQGAADADRRAVESSENALAGSDGPLLIASGTLFVAPGRVATERDGHESDADVAALDSGPLTRWATSELAFSFASRNVRSSVVRLPPTNHGDGDHGFIAALIGIAREKGVSGYIGDGTNRGLPCTGSIRLVCSRSGSRRLRQGRHCTPSLRRACRSARSPRSSDAISTCPWFPWRPRTWASTSPGSPDSWVPTARPRARRHANYWIGSPQSPVS